MNNVMIDISTLDLVPTSAIIEIGAVIFDDDFIIHGDFHTFICPICVYDEEFSVSKSTTDYWKSAYPDRLDKVMNSEIQLHKALLDFNEFIYKSDVDLFWCQDKSFDIAILNHAYSVTNQRPLWKSYNTVELSTLLKVANQKRVTINVQSKTNTCIDNCLGQVEALKNLLSV